MMINAIKTMITIIRLAFLDFCIVKSAFNYKAIQGFGADKKADKLDL